MKIALCLTTIHVPHVLKLYRACDESVRIFCAFDSRTPGPALEFVRDMRNAEHHLHGNGGWKCSEIIGFSTLARRNIAFLEALKWGADLIVSVDDDNSPIDGDYFWNYQIKLNRPFKGLCASSQSHWFDAGQLLVPWAKHRGIPHGWHRHEYHPIVNAKIGVMAGLVLGDSDVDATTRMERPDGVDTHCVSELARAGVVVDFDTHTVFNAQNVCLIRELVPAFFQMPGVGRHDDIWAALIVQRVARERELHAHFGLSFVHQQRNKHDLIVDLRAEIEGYAYVQAMATLLDSIVLPGKSVIADTRIIYEKLRHASWIPERAVDAAMAFLEDCESCV